MKLNEQQLASLSSPKAVKEYLQNQKENITDIIKQNLAVGDIFKRENLQVHVYGCLLVHKKTILLKQSFCFGADFNRRGGEGGGEFNF